MTNEKRRERAWRSLLSAAARLDRLNRDSGLAPIHTYLRAYARWVRVVKEEG